MCRYVLIISTKIWYWMKMKKNSLWRHHRIVQCKKVVLARNNLVQLFIRWKRRHDCRRSKKTNKMKNKAHLRLLEMWINTYSLFWLTVLEVSIFKWLSLSRLSHQHINHYRILSSCAKSMGTLQQKYYVHFVCASLLHLIAISLLCESSVSFIYTCIHIYTYNWIYL